MIDKQNFIDSINFCYQTFEQKQEQHRLLQKAVVLAERSFLGIEEIKEQIPISTYEMIQEYNDTLNSLRGSGKSFMDILNEKIFTDKFRAFEELLKDFFKVLYEYFPSFLLSKDNEGKLEVRFDDFFGISPNLENGKNFIIEEKVKKNIQDSNIASVIQKYETIFGIKHEKLKKESNIEVYHISLLRNIITHNNGEINAIYLDSCKSFKITPKYNNGDSLRNTLQDEINESDRILKNIAVFLKNTLESYYDNLLQQHIKRVGNI